MNDKSPSCWKTTTEIGVYVSLPACWKTLTEGNGSVIDFRDSYGDNTRVISTNLPFGGNIEFGLHCSLENRNYWGSVIIYDENKKEIYRNLHIEVFEDTIECDILTSKYYIKINWK